MRHRYGRRLLIRTLHEEEWSIVESRDPSLNVRQVLQEFGVPTHDEMTRGATERQRAAREKVR